MHSACPRCAKPRDHRDGPYFVCTECRWCWTVSITGRVYVQANWPPPTGAAPATDSSPLLSQRLLRSVEGLTDKLALPWPAVPAQADLELAEFAPAAIARLQRVRAATAADYFNEGVPLARLRAEGISLPPE